MTESIIKTYESRLKAFEKHAEAHGVSERAPRRVMAFLRLETDELPIIDTDRYSDFQHIDAILSPFNQWSEIDQRVFRFMTARGWCTSRPVGKEDIRTGFYLSFFRWYGREIEQGSAVTWDILEQSLIERGFAKETLISLLLEGADQVILDQHGALSTLGKMVEQLYQNAPQILALSLQENKRNGIGLASALSKICQQNNSPLASSIQQYGLLDPALWEHHPILMTDRLLHFSQHDAPQVATLFESAIPLLKDALGWMYMAKALVERFGEEKRETALTLVKKAFSQAQEAAFSVYDFDKQERHSKDKELICWAIDCFSKDIKEEALDYLKKRAFHFPHDFAEETLALQHYGQEAVPLVGRYLDDDFTYIYYFSTFQKAINLLKGYDLTAFVPTLQIMVNSGNPAIIQLGTAALVDFRGDSMLEQWKEALSAKDKKERLGAIYGLAKMNTEEARSLLWQVVEKEKEDAIRNQAATVMYIHQQTTGQPDIETSLAWAVNRGKLKRPIKKGLDESTFPPLYGQHGEALSAEEIRYLFYLQRDWQPISMHPEAKAIFSKIDKTIHGDFAWALFEWVQENGGVYAKNRFAWVVIAYFGDSRIIAPLQKFCIEKKNPTAASLLGFQDSLEAARALDAIMLAFKTKYPNVREAAQEAFDQIAQNRGISRFELMDEMIPNLGFEGLFREFEDNGKVYRAFIGKNLKMQFLDGENKVRKSLPASISTELKNEIKAINKSLRELTKGMKERLERALVLQRRWTIEQWQAFFLNKPLPFAMARALVWGVYEGDQLIHQFSVTDDQLFEDPSYAEIEILGGSEIGLIHPMELDEEIKTAWTEYLTENKLAPIFLQMTRPIYHLTADESKRKQLNRFVGKKTKVTRFKSRMEKAGWRRGAVMDAGAVENYFMELKTAKMDASLALENMGVVIEDYEEEVTLEELVFVAHESGRTGAYGTYWYREHDDDLVMLSEVPSILMSEVLADIEELLGE